MASSPDHLPAKMTMGTLTLTNQRLQTWLDGGGGLSSESNQPQSVADETAISKNGFEINPNHDKSLQESLDPLYDGSANTPRLDHPGAPDPISPPGSLPTTPEDAKKPSTPTTPEAAGVALSPTAVADLGTEPQKRERPPSESLAREYVKRVQFEKEDPRNPRAGQPVSFRDKPASSKMSSNGSAMESSGTLGPPTNPLKVDTSIGQYEDPPLEYPLTLIKKRFRTA